VNLSRLPIALWIANAAARLNGTHGEVTRQAEAADCSRQTVYDHAQKVQAAVDAEHSGGPTRAELLEENQQLRQENARLWDWLAQTVEFPPAKQHEFTVTATAMGLSLNQVLVLLALILGEQARPGRSTIQRRISRPQTYLQSGGADPVISAKSPGSL
jgi:regulator of replication initiation timing